ncbi:MAG: patatin-like phospholipase family protein [Flavobacteriaceae bacterium]
MRQQFGKFFRAAFATAIVLATTGCLTEGDTRTSVPPAVAAHVSVAGFEAIRFWGDAPPAGAQAAIERQTRQLIAGAATSGVSPTTTHILAISGGGSDGAFGAGLLAGWTAHGSRPVFDVVTGVSTGALTAPFAFLGPAYDGTLQRLYTQTTDADIATRRPLIQALTGDSLADTTPLRQLIAEHIEEDILDEIARQHGLGRRLYIATTNLDAQRPVIWDMGAIAATPHPDRLSLFRTVLLASAAIPAAFPPVLIRVTADGRHYEELHVDGGTTREVFLLPAGLSLARIDKQVKNSRPRRLFIIRNGKVEPEYDRTPNSTLSIAERSVSTLIKNQAIGDIYRMYLDARRDGTDFNLAYIPASFDEISGAGFDPEYMSDLYFAGMRAAANGYDWAKVPPEYN